ncbi:MAG TPA: hypothetical protein VFO65_08675, partial [Acidimicrobiales bacterium]|nr:hypothetical protein [Acidimicrobiales bacterium]
MQAKLRALVKGRWGDEAVAGARPGFLPGGAALAAADGAEAWVLAEDQPHRGLGPALTWATRHAPGAERVHVVAAGGPDVAGVLARRAEWFDRAVHVYAIEGTALVDARPAPLPGPRPADPRAEALRPMIERAGADYVVEGGLVRAEVKGLEVARVEVRDGEALLAVGVGRHDREARLDLGGTSQGEADLAGAVGTVSEHRREGGIGHPAYHLAPERWLRWVVVRR